MHFLEDTSASHKPTFSLTCPLKSLPENLATYSLLACKRCLLRSVHENSEVPLRFSIKPAWTLEFASLPFLLQREFRIIIYIIWKKLLKNSIKSIKLKISTPIPIKIYTTFGLGISLLETNPTKSQAYVKMYKEA